MKSGPNPAFIKWVGNTPVKEIRKQLKLAQKQLSFLLGISLTTLKRWEYRGVSLDFDAVSKEIHRL